MFSEIWPKKNYSGIEVYYILQHYSIKSTVQIHCKTMKEWNDCAEYLQKELCFNDLSSSEIIKLIKGKVWNKDIQKSDSTSTQLKSYCSCDKYDLLHKKGCDCGHIVKYKPKSFFK